MQKLKSGRAKVHVQSKKRGEKLETERLKMKQKSKQKSRLRMIDK